MAKDKKTKILETKLLIYECEGTESQIKEWFKTINIAGVSLVPQELLERALDWVSSVFTDVESEMKGFECGQL